MLTVGDMECFQFAIRPIDTLHFKVHFEVSNQLRIVEGNETFEGEIGPEGELLSLQVRAVGVGAAFVRPAVTYAGRESGAYSLRFEIS